MGNMIALQPGRPEFKSPALLKDVAVQACDPSSEGQRQENPKGTPVAQLSRNSEVRVQ